MNAINVAELEAQAAAIAEQIATAKAQAKADALTRIKAEADSAGLTIQDIILSFPKVAKVGTCKGMPAPVKYRNNATGETWSGRGMMPKWLAAATKAGAKLDDFAVATATAQAPAPAAE